MDTEIARELIDKMGAKWPAFVDFVWMDALMAVIFAGILLLATFPTAIFFFRWIEKAKDKSDASFGKGLTVVFALCVVIVSVLVIGSQISTLSNPEGAAIHHVFDGKPK